MEGWDIRGFEGQISAEDQQNFDVWCDAEEAALEACCAGWDEHRKPTSAYRGRNRARSLKSGGVVFRQVP